MVRAEKQRSGKSRERRAGGRVRVEVVRAEFWLIEYRMEGSGRCEGEGETEGSDERKGSI